MSNSNCISHSFCAENLNINFGFHSVFDALVQREIEGWNSQEQDNSDSDKSSVHSSDGSSRRTSTLQSESDETFQVYGKDSSKQMYFREIDDLLLLESPNRNRTLIKKRYLNKIAYLIAMKRNTLKRLALKGSSRTTRRVRSVKSTNRKLHRPSFRQPRKTNGKRINRMVSDCGFF